MKTRIVQIGNSRGIRLPKMLIEEAKKADGKPTICNWRRQVTR